MNTSTNIANSKNAQKKMKMIVQIDKNDNKR